MKIKKWPIYIWFLDNDLQKSASYLTDKALLRSLDGCMGALLSTIFYFIGIRSKKFYDYFFSKEQVDATMDRFFVNWPFKKKPSFSAYGRKESKWCRSCHENFDYCMSYLDILAAEAEYRCCKDTSKKQFLDWIQLDAPKIDFPYANIDDVVLPWKVIDPKFRKVDIVEGYRLQFINSFEDGDAFKAYGSCKRDIPAFVLEKTNASQAFES